MYNQSRLRTYAHGAGDLQLSYRGGPQNELLNRIFGNHLYHLVRSKNDVWQWVKFGPKNWQNGTQSRNEQKMAKHYPSFIIAYSLKNGRQPFSIPLKRDKWKNTNKKSSKSNMPIPIPHTTLTFIFSRGERGIHIQTRGCLWKQQFYYAADAQQI